MNAKDNQTLTSFAAVTFDKKVENWKITRPSTRRKSDAPLPDLAKKVKDLEAELAANTKAARAYNNERYVELDQLKALKKDAPVPANLAAGQGGVGEVQRQGPRAEEGIADAKAAVEKEKRSVVRSRSARRTTWRR